MLRIGYVDEDPGQRNSFYQFLKNDFEVILFEITLETEVDSIVDEIFSAGLDMLVLDFRLDETGLVDFNADSLVTKIQERNLFYPLIILTSHEIDALDHIKNANLVNGKEDMLGSRIEIFKQKISKLAHSYKNEVSEKENKLAELEEKRNVEGLSPSEEDEYVTLNSFLDKTTAAKGHLSRSFYSESTNERLDKLISKTEELLNKIPDAK